jgi:hypothetical protein
MTTPHSRADPWRVVVESWLRSQGWSVLRHNKKQVVLPLALGRSLAKTDPFSSRRGAVGSPNNKWIEMAPVKGTGLRGNSASRMETVAQKNHYTLTYEIDT